MCFINNIFYFKIFLKLQINITQHLCHFYRFIIFWGGGENNIYIQEKPCWFYICLFTKKIMTK
jgi:hypothetical protein